MTRITAPFATIVLAGLLGACAHTGDPATRAQPAAAADPAAPLPVAPLSSAAASPVVSAPTDAVATEPIIINGNDRLIAPPRVAAGVPDRAARTSLKFEAAPAAEVVKVMLGDLLKVDYVVHPPLSGTITLTTRQAVSADRALLLLESALQTNGIVMARDSGGIYHVGTPEALKTIVTAPVLAEPGKPLPPGYGAVIIPLEYLGAGEMANILRPMIAADAIVRVDSTRNILIMRGTRAEAEGWLDLVKTFDVNLLRGMSVAVFPLKHSSASEVEAALRLMSGGSTTGAAGAAAASALAGASAQRAPAAPAATRAGAASAAAAPSAPAGLGEGSPLFGALRVLPIERLNAIMVVTPRAAYLDEVRYWIEQFDRPNLRSTEPQLFVYKVQNGSADHLAQLLNGIYGGTAPQQGGFSGATGLAPGLTGVGGATSNVNNSFAGQFGANRTSGFGAGGFGASAGTGMGAGTRLGSANPAGAQQQGPSVVTTDLGANVRVMADRINNTLLIHAAPAEYERIATTLKRLDIQRAQILIEASIIEVTLGDGLEYGLQWAFNGGIGAGRTGTGVIGAAKAGGVLAADGSSPAGVSSAFTYTLRNAAGNISAVLSALANKSLVKVMSSPSLMVLDNHSAAIQVGTQQPVNTGTTISGTNNFQTTNIQYKDTGVMLGVTPSVSAGDLVTLDIDQMVTDVGPDSASAATAGYPTFMQRQINSKVAVRSGETLVLGGLIKDAAASGKAGLPGLSAIPVIGALFGRHRQSAERTELLVILTPRVLRSDEDARAVGRELRDRMQGLLHSGQWPAVAPARP